MRTIVSVIAAAAILSGGASAMLIAQTHNQILQTPKDTQWGPAPPMVPAGAQIAVLSGDPTKAGPYTVRLKFPASYAIPAHSHPTDENVIVVSGALTLGMGEKLAKGAAANKTLAAGGYAMMPANMNHFAFTGALPVSIVLYGQGPLEFKYVNPSDDPRNAKKGTR